MDGVWLVLPAVMQSQLFLALFIVIFLTPSGLENEEDQVEKGESRFDAS